MKKFKVGISFFVLLFLCLLTKQFFLLLNYLLALFLHEMAHLVVAVFRGYNLKQIKIDILGMSVELDCDIASKDVFAINIAGPVFNLFISLVCVAFYWLVPGSFALLNCFCVSNLVLSIFNLLPIYPLDGGKIFCGLIKSDKVYKRLDKSIRIACFSFFIFLFVCSLFSSVNWLFLLIAVFFLINKQSKKPSFSIFKTEKDKDFEKIVLLKVKENDDIYSLLKHINKRVYTVFYLSCCSKFFDEDFLIKSATKYPLATKLKDIIK